jgi:hypothetical protein
MVIIHISLVNKFSGFCLKIPFPLADLLCEFRDPFPPLSFGPHKPDPGLLLLKRKFPHEPVIIFQPW